MGKVFTRFLASSPAFPENYASSLAGRGFILTSGSAAVGLEFFKILYFKGATVCIASRSTTETVIDIEAIEYIYIPTFGRVKSLRLDLSDLTTIPTCTSTFAAQGPCLDVLWKLKQCRYLNQWLA